MRVLKQASFTDEFRILFLKHLPEFLLNVLKQDNLHEGVFQEIGQLVQCQTEEHLRNVIGLIQSSLLGFLLDLEYSMRRQASSPSDKIPRKIRALLLAARPEVFVDKKGELTSPDYGKYDDPKEADDSSYKK